MKKNYSSLVLLTRFLLLSCTPNTRKKSSDTVTISTGSETTPQIVSQNQYELFEVS